MPYTKEQQDAYNKEYYKRNRDKIKKARRTYYRGNVDKCLEYAKRYDETPEARAKKLERQREDRKRFPEKHRARKLVGRAVKSGKLKRMPCEMCGYTTVEAHHNDYSKPLEVRWLCRLHHRVVEGKSIIVSQDG